MELRIPLIHPGSHAAPRHYHAGAVVDGRLYVLGGNGSYLGRVDMYDPATNAWAPRARYPNVIHVHSRAFTCIRRWC